MTKRVNISTAREDLPALFDRVTSRDGDKVIIHRRDDGREALLVSRSYVVRLELANRRLACQKPFDVLGSLTIVGDPERVLEDVRAAPGREIQPRES